MLGLRPLMFSVVLLSIAGCESESADDTACTIADNGDETFTMTCPDGSSATFASATQLQKLEDEIASQQAELDALAGAVEVLSPEGQDELAQTVADLALDVDANTADIWTNAEGMATNAASIESHAADIGTHTLGTAAQTLGSPDVP